MDSPAVSCWGETSRSTGRRSPRRADNLQGSPEEHMSGRHSGIPESVPNGPYDVAARALVPAENLMRAGLAMRRAKVGPMRDFIRLFVHVLAAPFRTQAQLEAEITMLRHQLTVLR
jgi:hypothetical protein